MVSEPTLVRHVPSNRLSWHAAGSCFRSWMLAERIAAGVRRALSKHWDGVAGVVRGAGHEHCGRLVVCSVVNPRRVPSFVTDCCRTGTRTLFGDSDAFDYRSNTAVVVGRQAVRQA